MSLLNFTHLLAQTVTELSEDSSLKGLFHEHQDGDPLPSGKVLHEIIELCRAILFPGFYGKSTVNHHTITYHIGVNIERLYNLLTNRYMPDYASMPRKQATVHVTPNAKRPSTWPDSSSAACQPCAKCWPPMWKRLTTATRLPSLTAKSSVVTLSSRR